MPKPNYQFEKRQRELEKKKKKAEKAQRKAHGGPDSSYTHQSLSPTPVAPVAPVNTDQPDENTPPA
ncbi:MAG: hypothetical protein RSD57_16695 [Comamonas sp.]